MTYPDAKKALEEQVNDWVESKKNNLRDSPYLQSINDFYEGKKSMLNRYDMLLEYAIIHGKDEDAQNKILACKEEIAKVCPEESKIKELLAKAVKDVFDRYSQAFDWVKDPRFSGFLYEQKDNVILQKAKLIKLCVEFTEHSDGSFSIFTPSYVKELRDLDDEAQKMLMDMLKDEINFGKNASVKGLKFMEKSLIGMASHQKLREAITSKIDDFIMQH
jgi:hypothetical protein